MKETVQSPKLNLLSYVLVFTNLLLLLIISSCSLDRSNPLDPINNSSIRVPGQVIGVELSVSPLSASPRYIDIRWRGMDNVDGYYIYRAYSLHSSFERIVTITNNQVIQHRDDSNVFSGGTYWYKVSAFNDYPEGRLEGQRSTPQGRIVN